ncbi:MAG: hypothetical protein WC781_04760 [Candidatus Pacearchaeota archaeon]|jgi:hypothetical protein
MEPKKEFERDSRNIWVGLEVKTGLSPTTSISPKENEKTLQRILDYSKQIAKDLELPAGSEIEIYLKLPESYNK